MYESRLNLEGQEYTRASVRPAIKRYIKYKEKYLDRVCRKIWVGKSKDNINYMYANFCKNYDRVIVTIAIWCDSVGWLPMEIGKG